MEEISRGAEASISLEKGDIVKNRIKKGYRLDIIDEKLRKSRTKIEYRMLNQAKRAGVPTPTTKSVDETIIVMEHIDGKKIRDVIDTFSRDEIKRISKEIGSNVGKLHKNDIIHGDLTTSNMILSDKVFFIDFGLSSNSHLVEDKAVDLHLLSQAVESTHLDNYDLIWESILEGYKEENNNSLEILKRLYQIEERGRYKTKDKSLPIKEKIRRYS